MMHPIALVALLATTGCVTTAGEAPDVGNYKGQPSQPIIAKLGPPESQEATATAAVYRWRSSVVQESAAVRTTVTDYSTGRPQQVEETRFRPQMQYCILTLTVDTAGRVTDLSRDGSRQACAPLTDKLGL